MTEMAACRDSVEEDIWKLPSAVILVLTKTGMHVLKFNCTTCKCDETIEDQRLLTYSTRDDMPIWPGKRTTDDFVQDPCIRNKYGGNGKTFS